MLMYKTTQVNQSSNTGCYWLNFIHERFKSIAGLAVVMLFLFSANSLQAQVIPCIDGQSTEWGTTQMWAETNHDYQMDPFDVPNGDDIFTSSKDYKLYGGNGQAYNNWTVSSMQPKSDIMNAAAVILTGINPDAEEGDCLGYTDNNGTPDDDTDDTFIPYDFDATYLFFAGDRETTNGDGQIGFWFLINGSAPTIDADDNKIFSPEHYTNFGQPKPGGGNYSLADIDDGLAGDLLILANFEGGGRDAIVTVLMWVGAGNGTEGNNNSLIIVNSTAQVAENNAGTAEIPELWTVPADLDQYAANQFYEGVIDLSIVFDLTQQDICSTTWMLETRATKEITADSKDFAAGTFNLAPQIRAYGDTVCAGESDTLEAELYIFTDDDIDDNDDIVSNVGYTFHWFAAADWNGGDPDFGDDMGDGTYQFTTSTAGTYYVIATSITKCDAIGFGTAALENYPDPTVEAGTYPAVCADAADVTFTGSPLPGGGATGTWSGANVVDNGDGTATYDPSNGDVTATYYYVDANGCDGSDTASLTVNPEPTVEAGTYPDVCIDADNVTFTGSPLPGGGATGTWSGANVVDNGDGTATYDPSNGSVTATYYYVDANGCDGSDTASLTVNPLPSCSAYADNPLACEGAAIQLHVSGSLGNGGPYTFVWSGADASYFSSTTSPDPTFNAPIGIYNLSVTVTETSTGCTSMCYVSVEVYNCTPNCETGFAVKTEVDGDYTVVDEDYSSCFRNDGFRRWGWVNRIPASDQGSTVEFNLYAGAGRCDLSKGTNTGTVTVEYNNDGTVQVCYNLYPGFVMSEAHVYIGCEPYPTTNSGNPTVAPGQYSFNGGDLGYIQNYCTPVLEDVSGDFYVIVHAVVCESDIPEGCTPYPASQEEGGIFDGYTVDELPVVGCDVDTEGWGRSVDFTAYPVPFENEVNIKYMFDYDTDVKIEVFDIKGALIRESLNQNYIKDKVFTTKIDLSRTDNQMYFVRLTTDKGTVVKKIISSSNLSRE